MTYTQQWFEIQGQKNFENIVFPEFKNKENLRFLEIGCFEGNASSWLLKNVLTHTGSVLEVVDTFQGSEYYQTHGIDATNLLERHKENVKDYIDKVVYHVGFSQEILRKDFEPKEQFDFIYVDASHTSPDTLEDGILAWRLLKKGGIMIFDDYTWTLFPEQPLMNPKVGIDAFLQVFEGKYELLLKEHQVAIRKV